MKSLKYVSHLPSSMPLSAKVKNRLEITFFKGEVIPPTVTSYLITTGRLSPEDVELGEEDCR